MGTGTAYALDVDGNAGLGTPDTKTAEPSSTARRRLSAAPDFLGVRIVTIPVVILGTSPEDAFNGLADLNTAWHRPRWRSTSPSSSPPRLGHRQPSSAGRAGVVADTAR